VPRLFRTGGLASAWRRARWNTKRRVSTSSTARSEHSGCLPRLLRFGASRPVSAAPPSPTMRSPRRRSPASCAGQFVTRERARGIRRQRAAWCLNSTKGKQPQNQRQATTPHPCTSTDGNGTSAWAQEVPGQAPAPAGELTCALSGNGVLTTHLQEQPYYTGFHIARLISRVPMTKAQLLFYGMCIRANRCRRSYGRQANRKPEGS